MDRPIDRIQQRFVDYALSLNFGDLSPEAVHQAKVRIIDTLGALIAGFHQEPARISRNLAAHMPSLCGATIIGTRMVTNPDMAAFVNATTARYAEMTDVYHWPGSHQGHPSDVVMPVLAAAEHSKVSGRDLICGIVLAYEIFLRVSDAFHNNGFDPTTFAGLANAVVAGKLMGLNHEQLSHCISLAIIPNNSLRQTRKDRISMWKAGAAGQAGRSGLFAALLAREGMEGPHLPFEGQAGWCNHIAGGHFKIDVMGGRDTPFKILDTRIKHRPSCGTTISPIIAAEKVAPVKDISNVKQIIVEAYKIGNEGPDTDLHQWNPDSRESADHSVPYVVATTLIDGSITLRSFSDAQLWRPEVRELMQKVRVNENKDYTKAYRSFPVEHRTRITVEMNDGQRLIGESGGDEDDLGAIRSDDEIVKKFRGVTEEYLGTKRVTSILEKLWNIEDVGNVATLPSAFVLC